MIKFIKSPTGIGFGYSENDVCTLAEATEKELVELGFAEYLEVKTEKAESKPKAEKAVKK